MPSQVAPTELVCICGSREFDFPNLPGRGWDTYACRNCDEAYYTEPVG